ncbi:MAG: hypothetical protein J7L76_00575 [Spirochaetaceae bacterium]|nr:hypothetical protein [Spirochaetaceae bacterium]RKX72379.1 MAG: hypothetical protein DRP60_13765 [Spirochaetota bacterium]RKX97439.1 MAG: hypothetical protein DRZ90_06240 [Spirochaetota bacterium]
MRHKGSRYKFGTYTGNRVSGGSLDASIQGAMNREIVELPHSILTASLRAGRKVLWEEPFGTGSS